MSDKIKLAVIYGSVRQGRLCDKVVRWLREELESHPEFSVSIIDPLNTELTKHNHGSGTVSMTAIGQTIADADAFIIATPEYNHGYPGVLKLLIDSFYDEWKAKAVGFVSYGGMAGGSRAAEQLRQVFAELHAVTMRDNVSFINAWDQFDAQGRLNNPERARKALSAMLSQLHWWAHALRDARTKSPYSEVNAS